MTGPTRREVLAALACGTGLGAGFGTGLGAAGPASAAAARPVRPPALADVRRVDPAAVARRWAGVRPALLGERLPGVLTALPVTHTRVRGRRRPVAALTFDACANPRRGSDGYDRALVDTLRAHRVPATLFVSARWVAANPAAAASLAADPLFELANHGTRHVPLTVSGARVYGIAGTASAAQAVTEVWDGTLVIGRLRGGRRPTLFRCGTATYDDVGVAVARDLGQLPVGYGVAADFGASASAAVVEKQLRSLRPGGIALGHVNHPEKQTAEGLARALPRLLAGGWVFVRVSDVLR